MPLLPKILALLVVGYFLSPIDLIPDFIPVLGYLDELILLPVSIYFILKLIPAAGIDRMPRRSGSLDRPAQADAQEHHRRRGDHAAVDGVFLDAMEILGRQRDPVVQRAPERAHHSSPSGTRVIRAPARSKNAITSATSRVPFIGGMLRSIRLP